MLTLSEVLHIAISRGCDTPTSCAYGCPARTTDIAIRQTTDELAQFLGNADNAHLRERAADVRHPRVRLMLPIATNSGERLRQLAPDSILIARELLPSDLFEFNRECIAGIVTEIGGAHHKYGLYAEHKI
jgi:phosphoenolpyruvate-protein kinase (PTS system EI component)